MTWTPLIADRTGPIYRSIADALAEDVAHGRLKPGTRLPTHRDLAYRLGVTIGTITRAYAEGEKRGLLAGEVGRGTFVRPSAENIMIEDQSLEPINLTTVVPGTIAAAASVVAAKMKAVAEDPRFFNLLTYHPYGGSERHRVAGTAWMQSLGIDADPAHVLVSAGAQHGILIAFAALARAGDTVVSECLSYGSVRATAEFLGLKLRGLAMDQHGLLPDALDTACRSGKVRIIYCLPTLHNPTTLIMPVDRRKAIAEVARRHDVMIVEDDIYRPLAKNPPPPISFYAPERTITIAGLSKALMPGLRVAYLHGQAAVSGALTGAVRASVMMTNPIINEVAAQMIESGDAERIMQGNRIDAAQRQQIARRIIPKVFDSCEKEAAHLWLPLPAPWTSASFVAVARERGVSIWSADSFYHGLGSPPAAVRLGLGAAGSHERLQRALTILYELLQSDPMEATTPVV
jgi:DNA-binding transcriptional MocR family regulator